MFDFTLTNWFWIGFAVAAVFTAGRALLGRA